MNSNIAHIKFLLSVLFYWSVVFKTCSVNSICCICQDIFLMSIFPLCPLVACMTHCSTAIMCVLETRQECKISASNSKIIPNFHTRVSGKANVSYLWNDCAEELSSSLKEVTYIESIPLNVNNSHVRRFSHNKYWSNTD